VLHPARRQPLPAFAPVRERMHRARDSVYAASFDAASFT
jgi:hypothetical protein